MRSSYLKNVLNGKAAPAHRRRRVLPDRPAMVRHVGAVLVNNTTNGSKLAATWALDLLVKVAVLTAPDTHATQEVHAIEAIRA